MGFEFNESPRDRMTSVFRDIDRGVVGAQDRLVELVLPESGVCGVADPLTITDESAQSGCC